jgi:hypothetical protein
MPCLFSELLRAVDDVFMLQGIEKGVHGFRYDGSRMGFEMRDKAGWGCAACGVVSYNEASCANIVRCPPRVCYLVSRFFPSRPRLRLTGLTFS